MDLKFNIDRPKVSDEEIKSHQNFDQLVDQFKKQSLKQARGDESWRKKKAVRYSTVIAGVTVICTVTLFALYKNQNKTTKHETLIHSKVSTPPSHKTPPTAPLANAESQKQNAIKSTSKRFVSPPAANLSIARKHYTVDNAKGGVIQHPSSSRIKIPKQAFVDKAGKEIVGDVTIEYREFHDAADIILSGIPMAYDSAGKKYNLETAGMFEITGTQNGQPVFIHPDKTVQVELASLNAEKRFNQYFLDTVARNWNYLKKDGVFPNHMTRTTQVVRTSEWVGPASSPTIAALNREINVIIPRQIDSVATTYKRKMAQLPRYKAPVEPKKATPGRPVFNLDGSYDEFPELAAFKNVMFEVGPENTNYDRRMHEITWSDVRVAEGPVKGKNFVLTLSYRNTIEKLIVYPVLSAANFEEAKTTYQELLDNYKQLQAKKQEDEKRLEAEMNQKQQAYMAKLNAKREELDRQRIADLALQRERQEKELAANFNSLSTQAKATRLFNVAQFGIYNSDCPHPSPVANSIDPVFLTPGGKGFVQPEVVYLIDHTLKTVTVLSSSLRIHYNPGNLYSVCVFSKGQPFVCEKAICTAALVSASNKLQVIPMNGVDDVADFRKQLEL